MWACSPGYQDTQVGVSMLLAKASHPRMSTQDRWPTGSSTRISGKLSCVLLTGTVKPEEWWPPLPQFREKSSESKAGPEKSKFTTRTEFWRPSLGHLLCGGSDSRGKKTCKCWSLSRVQLFVTPWTVACQAPLSMESPGRIPEWVVIPFSRASLCTGIQPALNNFAKNQFSKSQFNLKLLSHLRSRQFAK